MKRGYSKDKLHSYCKNCSEKKYGVKKRMKKPVVCKCGKVIETDSYFPKHLKSKIHKKIHISK